MNPATPTSGAKRVATVRLALGAAVLICALLLGVFARFKGLGAAPLAVDEYFILRSTQNLLHHGFPIFDCGGIYSRGLLLQYLTALMSLQGVPLGVAPRLISAVSSLLALPAAYIIGRRVQGPCVGLLAVAILSVSLWETEIARFGRMYAPFQAVFLWYLVYFLRRTVDGEARADWPMLVLTVVATLIWEGGVFVALTNFLPIFLRRRTVNLSKRDWTELIKFVPVLCAAYWFVTTDFRMLGGSPALPFDYDPSVADSPGDTLSGMPSLWPVIVPHPIWFVWALVPFAATVLAVRALWLLRPVSLATAGLMAALLAALDHQFLASGAIVLMLLLFRFCSRQQLIATAARRVWLAIGLWAMFWLGIICASWTAPIGAPWWKAPISFIFPLLSVPNFIDQVLRPWGGAVPMLGAGLLLLVGVAFARALRTDEPGVSAERALLAALLCLLLAACASQTPRHETRYIFFLYPVGIILALSTITAWARAATEPRYRGQFAVLVAPALSLGAFTLTEDFQPQRLLRIDQDMNIYKSDMRPAQRAHLVVRDDTRALAQWLQQHAVEKGSVVVNAYQSLDYYDPKIDFFYVDRNDFNFSAYACRLGTIDRWSNRPLLQSIGALAAVISANSATYLVTYTTRLQPLLRDLALYKPSVQWRKGDLAVVAFAGASNHAPVTGFTAASDER